MKGFGNMNGTMDSNNFAAILQHAELKYVNTDTCNSNDNLGLFVDDTMMCAYEVDTSGCFGDSGGPLYDLENDLLVGVTSWVRTLFYVPCTFDHLDKSAFFFM